ncbi:MAG: hypothetical protein VX800_00125 [Chloroflexota bacterium]|nr:hypothetical protein [Chloroflexota bacterium]
MACSLVYGRLRLFLSILLIATLGCTSPPTQVNPKLPADFGQVFVSGENLSGYIDIRQEPSFTVATNLFGGSDKLSLPSGISLKRFSLASRARNTSITGKIELADHSVSPHLETLLSENPTRSVIRNQETLTFVQGSNSWSSNPLGLGERQESFSLSKEYPDVWTLFQWMPASPPAEPIAAGFVSVEDFTLETWTNQAKLELQGLTQVLSTIHVANVAFVVYSDSPLNIGKSIDHGRYDTEDISAMVVMKSAYPGFLLSFFLNNFADRVGLEKHSGTFDEEVFILKNETANILVKPIGSTLFLALGPDQDTVTMLISSILSQQIR